MFEIVPWYVWLLGGIVIGGLVVYLLIVRPLTDLLADLASFWKGF